MLKRPLLTLIAASVLALTSVPAWSQMGGGGTGSGGMGGGGGMPASGSMPGGSWPGSGTGNSGGMAGMGGSGPSGGMSSARYERQMHVEALQQGHRELLDFDPRGNLVVRNEIVGFGATAQGLVNAQAAGFVIARRDALTAMDGDIVVLTAPQGMSVRKALKRLREIDPEAAYDFNHIYFSSAAGEVASAAAIVQSPMSTPPSDDRDPARRIGLIDGGVDVGHAALRSLSARIHGCGGALIPSSHGTATASRLVAGFNGATPTVKVDLYLADVYCGLPTGGSTDAVIQALAWLMQENVPVINVSLVGPPNALLQRVVGMATARGHLIVAAVGNDGPAAPPLYPAAYPGVIAVTGVDRTHKALIEAGHGKFIAFAAPGADIEAAVLPSGYSTVRGTSFAAPIVASRLALLLAHPDPVAAERAVGALVASAVDLGSPGRDSVYGHGCIDCAAPEAARAH
jgi:subtilisin family serine protease